MVKKNLTIKERVKRINKKHYPDMSRSELIYLLSYWWKVRKADLIHAIETNATTV